MMQHSERKSRETNKWKKTFLDGEKGTLQAHYQNHFWPPVSAISCQVKTAAFIPLYLTRNLSNKCVIERNSEVARKCSFASQIVQKAYLAKYRWFFCNIVFKREANICPPGSALVKSWTEQESWSREKLRVGCWKMASDEEFLLKWHDHHQV